jgi:hypothetical protein
MQQILQENSLFEHFVQHFDWIMLVGPKGLLQVNSPFLQVITHFFHTPGCQVTYMIMAFIPEEWDKLAVQIPLKNLQHLECKKSITPTCQANNDQMHYLFSFQ